MTYCRSIMLMLAIRINCPSANCKWPRCSMLSRPHTHTHSKKKSERSVELYVYSFVSGRDPTKVLDTECERQIEIGFSQNTIIVCSSSMHIQLYVPCYTFTCLHSFFSEELLPSWKLCVFCPVLLAISIDFNSNALQWHRKNWQAFCSWVHFKVLLKLIIYIFNVYHACKWLCSNWIRV